MSRLRKCRQNKTVPTEKPSIGQRFRDAELMWYETTKTDKFCSLITGISKREAADLPAPVWCYNTSAPNRAPFSS